MASAEFSPTARPAVSSDGHFRVKAYNLFLTWQNLQLVTESRESCAQELRDFLEELEEPPSFITLCVEPYPTNPDNYHAHALITFDTNTVQRRLSLFWFKGVNCHYRRVSVGAENIRKIVEYCSKGSGTVANPEGFVGFIGHTILERKASYAGALTCGSREEARAFIALNFPRDYVCLYRQIQSFLDAHYRGSTSEYTCPVNQAPFILPEPLSDWSRDELPKVMNPNLHSTPNPLLGFMKIVEPPFFLFFFLMTSIEVEKTLFLINVLSIFLGFFWFFPPFQFSFHLLFIYIFHFLMIASRKQGKISRTHWRYPTR